MNAIEQVGVVFWRFVTGQYREKGDGALMTNSNNQPDFMRASNYRDSHEAFRNAIDNGFLSDYSDPDLNDAPADGTSKYAGNWMYMYSLDGQDYFKNINRRHYIKVPNPSA